MHIAFVDSTTPAVCHNLRIQQYKVFWDCARRGRVADDEISEVLGDG